jgi:hypothetical protein
MSEKNMHLAGKVLEGHRSRNIDSSGESRRKRDYTRFWP